MKKSIVALVCAVTAVSFLTSCGSKPKAAPKEVPEEKPVEVEKVEEPVVQEEIIDNSEDDAAAESARKKALEAGADKVAADTLAKVDARFQLLKADQEAGKNVKKDLQDVAARYSALELYAKALASKKNIEENQLASYDQAAYEKGCELLSELEALFADESSSGASQEEKAKAAYGQFTKVLFAAYKDLSKKEREEAFKAKKNADSVKAGAAAKEEYKAAVEEFQNGDATYAMQNPEAAYNHYKKAKNQFTSIYEAVSVKREAAQKAIDAAKEKVLESQSYAKDADVKAPLEGDDIQGIEADDAVLLEADEYADPATLEADIPETLEGEAAESEAE